MYNVQYHHVSIVFTKVGVIFFIVAGNKMTEGVDNNTMDHINSEETTYYNTEQTAGNEYEYVQTPMPHVVSPNDRTNKNKTPRPKPAAKPKPTEQSKSAPKPKHLLQTKKHQMCMKPLVLKQW